MRQLMLLIVLVLLTPLARAADEKPTTRPQRPQLGNREPGMMLKAQRERLNQLNLSDDQKKKLDEVFASAEGDFKKTLEETKGADPQERRQKMMPIMMLIREKVGEVLTDEQEQKLQQMGPPGGPGSMGGGMMIGRLKENLDKLDLSADQKIKVAALMEDSQKKADAFRAEIENGNADREKLMGKGMELRDETRNKLHEILTSDQEEKLHTMMQADGNAPGGRGGQGGNGRPGRFGGATTRPAKS